MAKKVRKDGERKEDKKIVFEPPEFDEKAWIHEQMESIRISIVFVLLAIPFGFLGAFAGAVWDNGTVGWAFAITGYIAAFFIFHRVLDIDIRDVPKKQIAISAAMFIFTYIAFSALFSNPPIYDQADPSITSVFVFYQKDLPFDEDLDVLQVHRKWLPDDKFNRQRTRASPDQRYFLWDEEEPAWIGDNITILVRAADAGGLENVTFQEWYSTPDRPPVPMARVTEDQWEVYVDALEKAYEESNTLMPFDFPYDIWGEHYWGITLPLDSLGNLYYKIVATDVNDQTRSYRTPFDDTVRVTSPFITSVISYVREGPAASDTWDVLTVHKDWLPSMRKNEKRISEHPRQKYFLWDKDEPATPGDHLKFLVRIAPEADPQLVDLRYWFVDPKEDDPDFTPSVHGPVTMNPVTEAQWSKYVDALKEKWKDLGMELPEDLEYEGWGEYYWEVNVSASSSGDMYFKVTSEDSSSLRTSFETKQADTVPIVV
jgi:hypothetical protein